MVRIPRPNPVVSRNLIKFCKEKGLNLNGVNASALHTQLREAAELEAFHARGEERARALEALLDKFGR